MQRPWIQYPEKTDEKKKKKYMRSVKDCKIHILKNYFKIEIQRKTNKFSKC